MLRWLNGHRMGTVEQVMQGFGMSKRMAYRRLSLMVGAGYLQHQRLFLDKPGVYWPTGNGVAVCGDDLPAISRLTLTTYEHDLQLVDLSLQLTQQTGGEWVPERRLRRDKGLDGVGVPGHVPDGLIRLLDGSTIAVELERTKKGNRRLGDILTGYLKGEHGRVAAVWYYCRTAAIAERVRRQGGQLVKTFKWPDLTPLGDTVKQEAAAAMESPGSFFWNRGADNEK